MNDENNRFLLFSVGGEDYGTPLLTVREVVEYQTPKYIPNMDSAFSGVINIRGTIVGVLDLRQKFNANSTVQRGVALLVCDTEQGPIAAVVDQVKAVVVLPDDKIEKQPPVRTQVKKDFVIGVAKLEDQLVTLIDLLSALSAEKILGERGKK
jgi:purine-binding chemotaxis protein CheW